MGTNEWITLIGIIASVFTSGIVGTWVVTSRISKSFYEIDRRIYGLETTVTPYASDIADLEAMQREMISKLAENAGLIASLGNTCERLEREIAVIRDRKH